MDHLGIRILVLSLLELLCLAGANFTINYEKNSFYLDGKPFRYVAGSAHYFRMPHQYWRDRLRKMRAGGLNAVSTYVEWSQHEPSPGKYQFGGDLNLTHFIQIAREEGLYVILRPGPYICAERDMGGHPAWLIRENPKMVPRSSDPKYMKYVKTWLDVLLPRVAPQLKGNGGPIIMVQVENEYGVHDICDREYGKQLGAIFKKHVQNKAVLFTTDCPSSRAMDRGKIPGVYSTIDFGPEMNVENTFALQRKVEPRGPLVNSEYYSGWFAQWGEKMPRKNPADIVKTLKKMLSMGANVNFYMYFGGTNFGFTAGARPTNYYQSFITSYDYDAPLTEAGDLTPKFYAIRDAIAQFLPPVNISVKTAEKANYGEITLRPLASLMSPAVRRSLGVNYKSRYPLAFEQMNQTYGYALYETSLRENLPSPQEYVIKSFNDYANIFLDGEYVTSLSREKQEKKFTIKKSSPGQTLGITVENLGRFNVGSPMEEMKGLRSNVTRKDNVLNNWNITSFEFKTLKPLEKCLAPNEACNNGKGFYFYMANFTLPANATKGDNKYLLDSFLDVKNLTKGFVFINDVNLGRYWSTRGPQYTLYVPGVYLKPYPGKNILIIMDEKIRDKSIRVKFTKTPMFSY